MGNVEMANSHVTYNRIVFIKLMGSGRSGETGGNVQDHVAVGSILVPELALNLRLGMAGRIVQENPKKLVLVTVSLVQVLHVN